MRFILIMYTGAWTRNENKSVGLIKNKKDQLPLMNDNSR